MAIAALPTERHCDTPSARTFALYERDTSQSRGRGSIAAAFFILKHERSKSTRSRRRIDDETGTAHKRARVGFLDDAPVSCLYPRGYGYRPVPVKGRLSDCGSLYFSDTTFPLGVARRATESTGIDPHIMKLGRRYAVLRALRHRPR
jgi:hypothetical protein